MTSCGIETPKILKPRFVRRRCVGMCDVRVQAGPNRLFIELLDSPVMDIADEHVALIYQTVKEAAMERLLNKHLKYTYEKLMFWEYFGDKLCNLMNADVYDPVKKKCVKSKSEIDLLTS
eukprot:Blabericola_migrator_1__3540@NODE_204_length_11434_cov_295_698249_g175_i0_p12_GENE_NODE_204_length_11434_cov_295_698249_g175_i0NODE_204_length_11434_cov_295_698249_g175_i0_p12_ORF_typecomplete_len119_score22_87_NODE_204_length_11434_cov_295_698249_g175_i027573113